VVEKAMPVTVEAQKEVAVESEAVHEPTPLPAPAETTEEVSALQRVATPAVMGKEMAPGAGLAATPEIKALVEAPQAPNEEQVEPTPPSEEAIIAAAPAFTPTAVVEALPPTPIPRKPTIPSVVRPGGVGLVLLRAVEAGLLLLALVLAVATLVAKRRQSPR